MTRTTDIQEQGLELAQREGDGIRVTLYWRKRDDRVSVTVEDHLLGDATTIEVHPADAMDAYEHPFAYAYGSGTRNVGTIFA
jgi:hypothetical protein